jgi:hypothetical protein
MVYSYPDSGSLSVVESFQSPVFDPEITHFVGAVDLDDRRPMSALE